MRERFKHRNNSQGVQCAGPSSISYKSCFFFIPFLHYNATFKGTSCKKNAARGLERSTPHKRTPRDSSLLHFKRITLFFFITKIFLSTRKTRSFEVFFQVFTCGKSCGTKASMKNANWIVAKRFEITDGFKRRGVREIPDFRITWETNLLSLSKKLFA